MLKTEILTALKNRDGYISGQELCEKLGVSRTAVWKIINQLKAEGYRIEAVQNKGYKIVEYPDIMTESEIKSLLQTKWAGNTVICYENIDSTNTALKRLAEEGAGHGTLVTAEEQSLGKGRRGRGWTSPCGVNIYMSLLLRPEISPQKASMLTLVMALAAAKACEEVTGLKTEIKWPNDIILNGKKICGILTEMSAEIDYINYVVIGVGINVHIESFPEELSKTATSLLIEKKERINRSRLTALVLQRFEAAYEEFCKTADLSLLKMEYEDRLVNRGREVRVLDPVLEYSGTAKGITNEGELIVMLENGIERYIYAGEVSVRGLYGYV